MEVEEDKGKKEEVDEKKVEKQGAEEKNKKVEQNESMGAPPIIISP